MEEKTELTKLAYTETQKLLYRCKKRAPFLVDVPAMQYLCFDGSGHPEQADYQSACETLYTLAYLIKFEIARKQFGIDFAVNPMEVTWSLDKSGEKTAFTWTMMLMQPDFITPAHVEEAKALAKKRGKCMEAGRAELRRIEFGKCVQCFHLGDYDGMNDTLAKMKAFAKEQGLSVGPYTHDIYLNDMRKTKVENYQTIMRAKAM